MAERWLLIDGGNASKFCLASIDTIYVFFCQLVRKCNFQFCHAMILKFMTFILKYKCNNVQYNVTIDVLNAVRISLSCTVTKDVLNDENNQITHFLKWTSAKKIIKKWNFSNNFNTHAESRAIFHFAPFDIFLLLWFALFLVSGQKTEYKRHTEMNSTVRITQSVITADRLYYISIDWRQFDHVDMTWIALLILFIHFIVYKIKRLRKVKSATRAVVAIKNGHIMNWSKV